MLDEEERQCRQLTHFCLPSVSMWKEGHEERLWFGYIKYKWSYDAKKSPVLLRNCLHSIFNLIPASKVMDLPRSKWGCHTSINVNMFPCVTHLEFVNLIGMVQLWARLWPCLTQVPPWNFCDFEHHCEVFLMKYLQSDNKTTSTCIHFQDQSHYPILTYHWDIIYLVHQDLRPNTWK